MVSSTYFFTQEPVWVERFNQRHVADQWFGARWDRLLPEAEYLKRAGKDDVPWENLDKSSNDSNYFPHVVTGGAANASRMFYKGLDYTPFANDLLVSFAEEAITNEKLGGGAETDVLTLSFSANDYVGHRLGPYSHEAMDMTLRGDRHAWRRSLLHPGTVANRFGVIHRPDSSHGAARLLSTAQRRRDRGFRTLQHSVRSSRRSD